MAEEVIIDIKINAEGGGKSLNSLRSEFKELQKDLNKADVGSKQYLETLKKLGNVKDEIGDLNTTIRALNPEGKVQALGTAIGGVASGFQAATAATALFGSENEELNKQLLRVQATMAFVDGIKGITSLGDSFKVLNTIIAANPFIAIATAIISAIGLITVAINDQREAEIEHQKERRKAHEERLKQLNEEFRKSQDFLLEMKKARGASEKEITEEERRQIDERLYNLRQSFISGNLSVKEYYKQRDELGKESILNNLKREKLADDEEAKRLEEKTKKNKEYSDNRKKKLEEDAANAAAGVLEFEKLSNEIDEINKKSKEQRSKDELAKLQADLELENAERRKQAVILEDIEKQKVQFQKDSITSIQSLSDTLFTTRLANAKKGSKEEEKLMKQQFDINKSISLSVASINAYQSIGAFLKTNPLTIAGIPNPGAIAGLAALVTTNAANIAKIAATKFNSGGGSGSTGGGQTASRVSATNAPTVNAPVTQTTQLNEDGTIKQVAQNVQPTVKAVVVETDITKTQKNVSGIQERAKY